jgi:hypothetical protein
MAAVLFVELPSANTEAAAGDRGGFFMRAAAKARTRPGHRWRAMGRSVSIRAHP